MPEGTKVLPWPREPRAPHWSHRLADRRRASADPGPPELPAGPHRAHPAKVPLLLALPTEPIRQAKATADAVLRARARRVGRDLGVVNCSDYGPGILLGAIRAHDGVLLREADVTVADAPDPDAPKVTFINVIPSPLQNCCR